MKKSIVAFALFLAALSAGAVNAAQTTVTLKVSGMTCASCPYMVRRSLTSVNGVKEAKVSLDTELAVVTFDDAKTTIMEMTQATTEAGFPSTLIEGEPMNSTTSSTAVVVPQTRGSN